MTWWRARFCIDHDVAETVAWLLAERLDHPVETRDQSTMSRTGDQSEIVIAFDNAPPDDIHLHIESVLGLIGRSTVSVETQSSEDDSWKDGWRAFFRGQFIGESIWVGPPWEDKPDRPVSIHIEPGMAFGTGTHATTQISLRCLTESLQHRAPCTLLDVGCGSAVLSIGAAQLGHHVVAVDVDESAMDNAAHNVRMNHVTENVSLRVGSAADVDGQFPVVVANILAPILIENAESIMARCSQTLILSGLMDMHLADIHAAFDAFELNHMDRLDEWLVLQLERRQP